MRILFVTLLLIVQQLSFAQKKPLDHSVYDNWQSIGERHLSADGKWAVYAITPQEGDANLYVHNAASGEIQTVIPRGYAAQITGDSRYLICRIKPLFKDVREARIKKKKSDDMPKDSIAVLFLDSNILFKADRVASFKLSKEGSSWLAYRKEKEALKAAAAAASQKTVDSLQRKVDSLMQVVVQLKNIKAGSADNDADEAGDDANSGMEGGDLVLRNLVSGKELTFKNVGDYLWDKAGTKLLLQCLRSSKDKASKNAVVLYDVAVGKKDTLMAGVIELRNIAISDDGDAVAFVAQADSVAKGAQRMYTLYLHTSGKDSAQKIVDRATAGMPQGWTVSEWATLTFSKSGKRLFLGTAPTKPPKDTSLVDIDLVKLDIWNYKDDYLQSQQLFGLQQELKRNYAAVYHLAEDRFTQLGSKAFPAIVLMDEGDAPMFIATTDTGRRVQAQWAGRTEKDVYAIEPISGKLTLAKASLNGTVYPSASGKYILWYDAVTRQYYTWDGKVSRKITGAINKPLFNEDHDSPSEPAPYGVMGWHEGDSAVYVYDKYDVWKVDPMAKVAPQLMFAEAKNREKNLTYRYVRLDSTERFFSPQQQLMFRVFDHKQKTYNLHWVALSGSAIANPFAKDSFNYNNITKAKDAAVFMYTKERFDASPDVYVQTLEDSAPNAVVNVVRAKPFVKLSATNPQHNIYNWGVSSLVKWKAFDGKSSEGILYKPEDFDPTKKYPMIVYFYEKMSETLNNYIAPAPTPSRINIPFFVSRGYLVFVPDISYTKGQPAKDAYNYIVSGVQSLTKHRWVDAANIGLQGQSWGGYQVLALIVQTPMFKAAWAGAPVANMTSAYGGIRWESGANRQFQYEKQQSRIGATLWERPDLYIQNSPLFQLPNVKTPLVVMANDADGAVPWYQGIELFTAMRRLNKPVWMLNYNGEAHNLVERKNRKDIQVRQQQFFDWQLKGAQPPQWITEGVPATEKGMNWGLGIKGL